MGGAAGGGPGGPGIDSSALGLAPGGGVNGTGAPGAFAACVGAVGAWAAAMSGGSDGGGRSAKAGGVKSTFAPGTPVDEHAATPKTSAESSKTRTRTPFILGPYPAPIPIRSALLAA